MCNDKSPVVPPAPASLTPVERKQAAEAALEREDFVRASGLFQASLLEPPDDSVETRIGLLKGLSIAAARSARFAEALTALDEWDLLCRTHDRDRFPSLKVRGNCLAAMDLFDPALDAFREAWALVRETDRHTQGGAILNNIGSIYHRLKDFEAAEQHFRMAVQMHRKAANPIGLRHATYNLATSALRQGDYPTAREAFLDYLEKAEQEGNRVDFALGNHALAEVYAKTGEDEAAVRHFAIASAIYEETGQRQLMVQLCLTRIEWELNRAARPAPSPLDELTDIITESEKQNWHEWAINALELKARVCRATGDFAAACEALTEVTVRQKSLHEEASASQMRSLRILHNTEVALAEAAAERQRSELLEANLRETEAQRQRAEKADEVKTRVLRTVSHELRNPLGAISSCLELAEDVPGTAEAALYLSSAQEVAGGALVLLNQLLDAAEMDSGTIRLKKQSLDLNALLRAAIARFLSVAEKKSQTINLTCGSSTVLIEADEARLGIVLDNLISNAIKYSPAGSAIRTAVQATESGPAVFVRDEGPGLSQKEMTQLFQLFGRIDRTQPTGDEKAVGLGLYIARHIARLHGGDISVESEGPGCGSTFLLRLPTSGEASPKADAVRGA